jgi:hypothetical protein
MKIMYLSIVFGTLLSFAQEPGMSNNNGVVAQYSGGRFGDNLMACAHALYFALKNSCTLYIQPFLYSDHLMMDELQPHYTKASDRVFKYKRVLTGKEPSLRNSKNTLFMLPYFAESAIERSEYPFHFQVDWDDALFQEQLHKLIQPKRPLNLIVPPKDTLSVAVHVRKGGSYQDGLESELANDVHKMIEHGKLIYKIPVDQYYINQIKYVAEMSNVPLYVFIFTDDKNPQALVQKYADVLHDSRIIFDYRKENNDHCYNVLEDFFSMMQFDILIRPESNFSLMAEKLAHHKLVISPGDFIPGSWVHEGIVTVKDDGCQSSCITAREDKQP